MGGDDQRHGTTAHAFDRAQLAACLKRVGAGDHAAFAALYQATFAKLFGLCVRVVGNAEEAEEVLQDVYLLVWRRAGTFDEDRGTAMTWLITLTRNRALDRLRRTRRRSHDPLGAIDAMADPAPIASEQMEADAEARRVQDGLDRLESDDLRLIRASYLDGSTYAELAERASLPIGTVKSRVRRAILRLRESLR